MTAGSSPATHDDAEPRSIDLREGWQIICRRWGLILAVTLIGAVAAAGYLVASGPKYAATSQVVVFGLTQGTASSSQTSGVNPQVNMSTEQAIAESPAVVAQTAKIIGVQSATLQNAAAKRLTVTVPASTLTTSNVLQITWTAPTAQAAQTGANAFAAAYLSYRHRELEGQVANLRTGYERELSSIGNQISQLTGQVNRAQPRSPALARLYFQLTQLRQQGTNISSSLASLANYNISGGSQISAALPTTRSGLGRKVILTLGILLPLLIGLVLAFIRDAFDDRVRTPAQLERSSGVPTLAVLPAAERSGRLAHGERHTGSAVAVVASPDSRAADAVRALRATLTIVAELKYWGTLLVAAADASVSSGSIAAEIGLALAESGRRVLLVAADMRGSALPPIFGMQNKAGLSDLLVGGGDPESLIRQPEQASGARLPGPIARRLAVLPSGTLMPHALSVLDSSAMVGLLHGQREASDFVVLDSPPVTSAADVFALAGQVDGVILVARTGRTRERMIGELRRTLDQVGAVVIGCVFIGSGKAGRHRPAAPDLLPLQQVKSWDHRPATPGAHQPQPARKPSPVVPGDAASSTAGNPGQRL